MIKIVYRMKRFIRLKREEKARIAAKKEEQAKQNKKFGTRHATVRHPKREKKEIGVIKKEEIPNVEMVKKGGSFRGKGPDVMNTLALGKDMTVISEDDLDSVTTDMIGNQDEMVDTDLAKTGINVIEEETLSHDEY